MAFYAEIYGFIALNKGDVFPQAVLEKISLKFPILKACFSEAVENKSCSLVSFASIVKLESGEESLWLEPFEALLKETSFLHATVSMVFEESILLKMYTYIHIDGIIKIESDLLERSSESKII